MIRKRNKCKNSLKTIVAISIIALMFMASCFPGTVKAAGIGDVVTEVANNNLSSPKFDFGTEDATGLNLKAHMASGDYGKGAGIFGVVGPINKDQMKSVMDHIAGVAGSTGVKTTPIKGGEVREYTMKDGVGITVVLPDYLITIEIYETGNSSSADIATAKKFAQQLVNGLDKNGLLSQPAPDIQKPVSDNKQSEKEKKTSNTSTGVVVKGKALKEAVAVSNTDNIGGVKNGPTAPTTFTINVPHLITYIRDYHWNNAKGDTPGTIALKDQKGVVYGPWQAKGTDGMGGVKNANWEVYPNVVIPAGTYTIIDSNPATWAQNQESGGRGMGQVKATPQFQVTSGSLNDLGKTTSGNTGKSGSSISKESPAGVGSVGTIPGPKNNTEAVVGVAVPGLIATVLAGLAGLGGGIVPPGGTAASGGGPISGGGASSGGAGGSTGGAPVSGGGAASSGGTYPEGGTSPQQGGTGKTSSSAVNEAAQLGRRRRRIDKTDIDDGINISIDEDLIIEDKSSMNESKKINNDLIDDSLIIEDGLSKDQDLIIEEPLTEDKMGNELKTDEDLIIEEAIGIEIEDDLIIEDGLIIEKDFGTKDEVLVQEAAKGAKVDEKISGVSTDNIDIKVDKPDSVSYEGDILVSKDSDEKVIKDRESADKEYDSKGFDSLGYDKEGFNKAGFDKDGYDRNGLSKDGFDREGYDKDGYDKKGYNREGYNREGRQQEGLDEYGYDKKGFNKDGFDKDGYDTQGFDYKGYNRDGYDPWGYNRQGYDKDGYHWSGYNSDGYNRSGKHWSDLGYDPEHRNPFDGGPISLDGSPIKDEVPKAPPLGQPYPKTAEKYGPKPWTTEPSSPKTEPAVPSSGAKIPSVSTADKASTITPKSTQSDSGIIGPEDPMNTLKHHGVGEEGKASGLPIPEEDIPSVEGANTVPIVPGAESTSSTSPVPEGFPKDGEKRTLVGETDGRTYEIEYDASTGHWRNTETGGEFYPDRFEQWQKDMAEDRRRSAIDIEKMSNRQDANSKAIDQALGDWKKLENMQKAADKYNIGEKGGPGDVDKAIQDLKDQMLSGKELDGDKFDRINKVIDSRIKGDSAADTGTPWQEEPWYKDIDSAFKANKETIREVVTGEDSEGNTSVLGMGARAVIGAATGGASEYIMTVAEAMNRIKTSVDKGKSDYDAVKDAVGQLIFEEVLGEALGRGGEGATKKVAEMFPNFTKNAAELVEKNVLKIMKADQLASRGLGLVGKESADQAIKQIEKRLTELGADAAGDAVKNTVKGGGRAANRSADDVIKGTSKAAAGTSDDLAKGTSKSAAGSADDAAKGASRTAGESSDDLAKGSGRTEAGSSDDLAKGSDKSIDRGGRSNKEVINDPAAMNKAEKTVKGNMKNFDKMPPAKQQELIKEQAIYDEYRIQAEEKTWNLADKVQRGEPITVKDALDMKADPASMRTLKDIRKVDGVGAELGTSGSINVQKKFNEVLNEKVYEPSYDDVRKHLSNKFDGAEIRVETVRTPGKEYHPWDINTDNDIIATRKVQKPDGSVEWVEVPRSEWEDKYFESYAKNTGFNTKDASQKFPSEDWSKMTKTEQARKWAELHGESPTDVYHPEGARDFSTQKTSIMNGQRPEKAAAAQAAAGEGKLLDAEGLGLMEKNKINHYWEKGDIKNQTEALEQLKKAANQAQNLEKGYKNMGYKIADMPKDMKDAIKVVNNSNLSPAARAARLQELGYDTPGDFVDKLTSRIGSLKAARK